MREVLLLDNHRVDERPDPCVDSLEIEHVLRSVVTHGQDETIDIRHLIDQHRVDAVRARRRNRQHIGQRHHVARQSIHRHHAVVQRTVDAAARREDEQKAEKYKKILSFHHFQQL